MKIPFFTAAVAIVLVCAFAAAPAHALTLEELQTQLAGRPVVRCDFVQERQISGFARPLKSQGAILVARDHGLWWHQQKPFEMTLLLDSQRMVQTVAGQAPQIITAEKNPQLFQFNHLLVAIFRADRAVLEKNFTVTFTDGAGWTLVLIPKEAPLNKVFRRITLTGDSVDAARLVQIVLEDTQNDRTTLRFLNHRGGSAELSEVEKAYFK
ncbi:MAG: outer membrane lipoprotein carrier protein LolA [Puniceicoccales bacterium]|jgi:outer membrane lipoprotein-sorting protein|nr:outer membrane lipoprotein carrier protein LolA [Puniceicoccales bacterium]